MLENFDSIIHRCFRCGYCKLTEDYGTYNCPIYSRFRWETTSPGGLLWLIRGWMLGKIEWSEQLAGTLYACTLCNNCVEHCKFKFSKDITDIFIAARQDMVADGKVLPRVARFLRNIEDSGNPYRETASARELWTGSLEVPRYNGQEYLLYVGCVSSYDERGQNIARALAKALMSAGVSFGILGKEEVCEGNEVRILGEDRLFSILKQKNAAIFKKYGVDKIITISPHSYNAFKKYYDGLQVYHYTQILSGLIEQGKLNFRTGQQKAVSVTYHDSCFLGRHNGEYDAPRAVLSAIPAVKLVELERNRADAFCCGGGSANFQTDFLGCGEAGPSRLRIREAHATGADIIAVACPACLTMLAEAVKAEQLEDSLQVRDISEIVLQSLQDTN